MKKRKNQKGFLLLEALIAILILSMALVASLGGIAQALGIAKRGEETTQTLLLLDRLLYELETGERLDLLLYGGKGEAEGGYRYEIQNEMEIATGENTSASFSLLKTRLIGPDKKEAFKLQTFLEEVPLP